MCNIWQDNLIKLSRFLGWIVVFLYLSDLSPQILWPLSQIALNLCYHWHCKIFHRTVYVCVCMHVCARARVCTVGGICVLLPFQYRYCFLVGNYARLLFCCFILQSPSLWYFVFCDWHLYARGFSFFCLPNSKESARLIVDMIPQRVICVLFIYFLWPPPPPLLSVC